MKTGLNRFHGRRTEGHEPCRTRAFGEVETAFRAGFRSLRAWRWARRKGGFPGPKMHTPDGPVWSESQIDAWLGEAAGPSPANDNDDDDEARLLRKLEAA
jgi:hypothetical protein